MIEEPSCRSGAESPSTLQHYRLKLALELYRQERLSIGKARELAGMSLWEFRQVLGAGRISPHYDVDEFREDLATLARDPQSERAR